MFLADKHHVKDPEGCLVGHQDVHALLIGSPCGGDVPKGCKTKVYGFWISGLQVGYARLKRKPPDWVGIPGVKSWLLLF